MLSFVQFITEATVGTTYNDEHAHVHVWNHLMDHAKKHKWDLNKMHAEIEKSKTDENHPLHFNNISHEGFTGGVKTEGARKSYHDELKTAVNTVHALSQHPLIANSISKGHRARVTGASSSGEVSALYRSHGATNATSKTDVAIGGEDGSEGIKLSMKKGGGSQLMSGGPEEMAAVHDYAARQMLAKHPQYKRLSKVEKDKIHSGIMKKVAAAGKLADSARHLPATQHGDIVKRAQSHMDAIADEHPALNHFLRKEAATGEGKFGKGSHSAASFLVKSSTESGGAKVSHVDDIDFTGPRIRVAKPKGKNKKTGIYRSLNFKLDERKEKTPIV